MRVRRLSVGLIAALTIITAGLFAMASSAIAQEQVLYNFNGDSINGAAHPTAAMVFDAAGNLYGTTSDGGGNCGSFGCGTVFELSPEAGGGWTTKLLYRFPSSFLYGFYPLGGVILDPAGNLYGTTVYGGTGTNCGLVHPGTVFELSPAPTGLWTAKVLHNFGSAANCADGGNPFGSLSFDAAGNLYGTTTGGGTYGYGTVFELSPARDGSWNQKVLHSFDGEDGQGPESNLVFDSTGNLYGTTWGGGAGNYGTVFELMPGEGGNWTEKVLHNFYYGSNGYQPLAGVIFDAEGNLYSTTQLGGNASCFDGCGTVFELTPQANGSWTKTTLYKFVNGGNDGYTPQGGVIFDSAGNLYGTTEDGGTSTRCPLGCGTAFELTRASSGSWFEKVLYDFGGYKDDGQNPEAGLTLDSAGTLYGTTWGGGAIYLGGTVFELTP
jgi:uncharacterized repeat protein (TIGR03803 family)